MSNHAALIQRLRGAKPVDERDPFIGAGKHKLALAEFFLFDSKKHGEAIGARFVVLESTNPNHQPGSICFQGWYINRMPFFVGDTGEVDRAADFVAKLQNVSLPETGPQFESLFANMASQPARGMMIDCSGNPGQGKAKADGTPGKQFVDKVWTTVQQGPQQVAQMRGWLDSVCPMQARHEPPPSMQAPPQNTGYGAPAPQGYPGHGGSAMGAYAGAPPQGNGYGQAPPPPGYGQPPPQTYAPAPQGPPPGQGYYPGPSAPSAPTAPPGYGQAPPAGPGYPSGPQQNGGFLPPGFGR